MKGWVFSGVGLSSEHRVGLDVLLLHHPLLLRQRHLPDLGVLDLLALLLLQQEKENRYP